MSEVPLKVVASSLGSGLLPPGLTNLPGHLWRAKWTALSGPLSPPSHPPTSPQFHHPSHLGVSSFGVFRGVPGGWCRYGPDGGNIVFLVSGLRHNILSALPFDTVQAVRGGIMLSARADAFLPRRLPWEPYTPSPKPETPNLQP
jgi:hypothetical protein